MNPPFVLASQRRRRYTGMLLQRVFPVVLTLVVAIAAGSLTLRAATPPSDGFAKGNALYAEGKFAEAAASYETVARQGEFSANLFYNLAGSYYRLGDRGRAILNYQRALLLEPRHTEAAANLAFVRGRTSTAAAADKGIAGWLDVDTWTWVAAVGAWLAVIGLGTAVLRRRSRGLAFAAGLTGMVVGATAGWAIYRLDGGTRNPTRAVVLSDETRALYSPADNSKAVSVLAAGGEVLVLSEQGAWDYVHLGDGSRGWVASDRVEKVVPPAARTANG